MLTPRTVLEQSALTAALGADERAADDPDQCLIEGGGSDFARGAMEEQGLISDKAWGLSCTLIHSAPINQSPHWEAAGFSGSLPGPIWSTCRYSPVRQ